MELKGLKINILGDSITEGHGTSGVGFRYTDVFEKKSGAIVRNYGVGGSRIARQHVPSANPRHDLNYLDRAMEMDDDADVVVVFGGTNDFGHGDAAFGDFADAFHTPGGPDEYTFCGAMHSLIRRLMEKYPDAQLVFMTPIHRCSEDVVINERGIPCHQLIDYVEMEKKICAFYAVPVLDLWSVSGIQPRVPGNRTRFCPDGLHPNDAGAVKLADKLLGFLKSL